MFTVVSCTYSREWCCGLSPTTVKHIKTLAFQARIHGSGCRDETRGTGWADGSAFQARIHGSGCCDPERTRWDGTGNMGFQARIHGSGCCDVRRWCRATSDRFVSSPYSRELQPCRSVASNATRREGFKPVFTGVGAATTSASSTRRSRRLQRFQARIHGSGCCDGYVWHGDFHLVLFQARIHGSGCCDRCKNCFKATPRTSFKPVFTGVGAATCTTTSKARGARRFQARIHGSGCCDRWMKGTPIWSGPRFKPVFTGVGAATVDVWTVET